MNFIHYIPIFTTLFGAYFLVLLFRHWNRNRKAMHIFWWMIGVACYIAGTITESINTLSGFSVANLKAWYITGALLGGAPLAQGTVYLLLKRRTGNIVSVILVLFVVIAATLVILSPVNAIPADGRLSGKILSWTFVRYLTPFVNLYAFIFLVGGAVYSALKYRRDPDKKARVRGNILIALGGLLPGIGGTFTKFGYVEVLYVTEFAGLLLIYLGYSIIKNDKSDSVHVNQLNPASETRTGRTSPLLQERPA